VVQDTDVNEKQKYILLEKGAHEKHRIGKEVAHSGYKMEGRSFDVSYLRFSITLQIRQMASVIIPELFSKVLHAMTGQCL